MFFYNGPFPGPFPASLRIRVVRIDRNYLPFTKYNGVKARIKMVPEVKVFDMVDPDLPEIVRLNLFPLNTGRISQQLFHLLFGETRF